MLASRGLQLSVLVGIGGVGADGDSVGRCIDGVGRKGQRAIKPDPLEAN